MPEIEFIIDTETGKCETEIKGIQGAACEKAARELKQLLGNPTVDKKTKEFYAKPEVRQQIKGK
jgi:Mn-dependent DtxR family transcriptional regulator